MEKSASGPEGSANGLPEKSQEVVGKESSLHWGSGLFAWKQNQSVCLLLNFSSFFVFYDLKPSLLFPTSPPHCGFQK